MAFLRSICAQRTNLVYSFSVSGSSSLGAGKRQFGSSKAAAAAAVSNNWSNDELKYSSSGLSQRQRVFPQTLFASIYGHQQRGLHTNATKSQTVAATQTIGDEQKSSVYSKSQLRRTPPTPNVPENPQRDPLDVSFNDPVAAFKSKTTWELVRAYLVYMICSSEKLVEHNMKVS
ncbi:proline dehydrogenase 1, mitochondrial-like, partial [Musca vetustissima]|uniref:proline dehydrogenase 1, mitochondrial-like n=1 Tax=Musca vetustissima TaxID=27455 RepID=UPI002AB6F722